MTLAALISSILAQSFQPGWRTDSGLFGVIVIDSSGNIAFPAAFDSHAIAVDDKTQG